MTVVVEVKTELELCDTCSFLFSSWLRDGVQHIASGNGVAAQTIAACPVCLERCLKNVRSAAYVRTEVVLDTSEPRLTRKAKS